MADQKLTDRGLLSSSKDNSYVHIVQDGASLKQTKGNFLREDRGRIEDLEVTKFSNTARIDNIENNQYSGVITYELDSTLIGITGVINTSYKVTNDPDTSLNGYYHWSGSAYVKDADLANGIIKDGNTDAVSGDAVYDYTEKFITGIKKNTEAILPSKYIHPDGTLTTLSGYIVKSYVVTAGEDVLIAGVCAGDVAQYAFYSDSGLTSLIEVGADNGSSSDINLINLQITTPSGATYVAICEKATAGEIFCYTPSTNQAQLEVLKSNIDENNSTNKTYQTLDISFSSITDYYINTSGVLIPLSSYEVKKYAVTEGDYIKLDALNFGSIAL